MQLGLRNDELMVVCPTVSATHCLSHSHILSVLCSDNDVVDEMPVLGVRLHPRCLVASWKAERGVGDGQAMGGACPKQEDTTTVAFPYSVRSDDAFPRLMVLTDTSIEVIKR